MMQSMSGWPPEDAEFYGEALALLAAAQETLAARVELIRRAEKERAGRDPVEHVKTRMKKAQSMREKLMRRGFAPSAEAALRWMHDAVGVRVVCSFLEDVYRIAEQIRQQEAWTVLSEKDYIHRPKPNGYRSYHMIVQLPVRAAGDIRQVYGEVQLRTLAMDTWASLEHEMKYKGAMPDQGMLADELKRCADEIASTDLSLQTLRDLMDGKLEKI